MEKWHFKAPYCTEYERKVTPKVTLRHPLPYYRLAEARMLLNMEFTVKQLLNQVQVLPDTGCWEFRGTLDSYGYGRMYSGNKELKAHRVFYEACERPIPEGMYLQHHLPPDLCIGQACCNPDHLRVTNSPIAVPRVQPAVAPPVEFKTCPNGHPMTPENTVTERRNGHPKDRCRTCRQESWRKNAAQRSAKGLHS